MNKYCVEKDNKLITYGILKPKEIITKYLIPDIENEIRLFASRHYHFQKVKINNTVFQEIDRETFIKKCVPISEKRKNIIIILELENNFSCDKKVINYTIKEI